MAAHGILVFGETIIPRCHADYFFNKDQQPLIRDLITAGKQNGRGTGSEFVAYHFPRLGQTKAVAKLSYSMYLERWQLMIGTGV